jgi:putative transferase (TIGR04331 family)
MTRLHLVTTAEERSWPSKRKILFLGKWCTLWDRRDKWQSLDSILAKPYGLGEQSKDADHLYVRELEMSLFPELCDLLGRWHGVSSDQRYWRIILGHWFRRYVEVIFNRTRTLQSCISKYSIESTTVLENLKYSLVTRNSNDAIWASNDDRWNHELYVRLMKSMPELNIRFEKIIDNRDEKGFNWSYTESKHFLPRVASGLRRIADRTISLFQAEDDLLIFNTYLPRSQELKLQLLLGQFPRLLPPNSLTIEMEPNIELRSELGFQISSVKNGDVEEMVRNQLFELLPVCYLEGFSLIKKHCSDLTWSKKPRAIFTSNNFDTDEIFKSWVADKVLQGSKYIVGQHGNNYGTHRYSLFPAIEEITADRFITWGWQDGLPQHRPACLLKTVGRKAVNTEPRGELLLIEVCMPHRMNTWDVFEEFNEYFEDQKRFVRALSNSPVSQLRIRLHGSHKYFNWGEVVRWSEFNSVLNLDNGTEKIDQLISRSRLVVHSYDSTGILETLSQNIPTVAFWQNGLEHLRDSARPWYKLLIDVGIVHLSATSAAAHVNDVWEDVGGWWMSNEVQIARAEFCNQYARNIQNPLESLKKIIFEKD